MQRIWIDVKAIPSHGFAIGNSRNGKMQRALGYAEEDHLGRSRDLRLKLAMQVAGGKRETWMPGQGM